MITASEAREKLDCVIQQAKENVSKTTLDFCENLNPIIEDAVCHYHNFITVIVPPGVSRKEVWAFMEQLGYTVSGIKSPDQQELRICW